MNSQRSEFKLLLAIMLLLCLPALCTGDNPLNKDTVNKLLAEAKRSHSTALVIWKDGKLIGEWYFSGKPGPIEAMSATKSVVNLAIGLLVTQGKIHSIDQPIYDFFPEWKQGRKQSITIRHLLTHTSGLQNTPTTGVEIYPSPDFIKLALAAELVDEPGTRWDYNNKAVNLLAGIVQRASGKRMDIYLRDELFRPLGIKNFHWELDKAGNPHAMSGLQILPNDLAKIGQFVLNGGIWGGRRLIAESWFDISMRPGHPARPECGFLWWLVLDHLAYIVDDQRISELEAKGADPAFLARVKQLKGRYENKANYYDALIKVFGSLEQAVDEVNKNLAPLKVLGSTSGLAKQEAGNIVGYSAEGYLGQYLIVIPKSNLIIVRMVQGTENYNEATDGFYNLKDLALELSR